MLGLTGPNAAGKGEAASYLCGRGFALHSLSDVVREEAAARGLPPTRENLIRIGQDLRRDHGVGVLAERIASRLGARDVVDSIRSPFEVAVLRRVPGFRLVGVDAPMAIRFGRALARARPGDPSTLAEFESREREENSEDPEKQQLAAAFRLADCVVDNGGELRSLHAQLDRILARWLS